MNKINTKSGFTLIELLVVIAIIGVLSTVVTGSLQSGRSKARNAERLQTADQIQKAMEIYSTATGANRLPAVADIISGDSNTTNGYNNTVYCLGGTPGVAPCNTTAISANVALNNEIKAYLGGGVIPKNPTFPSTSVGSFYRYVSASVQNSTFPQATIGTFCNPATNCPAATYLLWSMERKGGVNCGRGFITYNDPVGAPSSYSCALRLGDRIRY